MIKNYIKNFIFNFILRLNLNYIYNIKACLNHYFYYKKNKIENIVWNIERTTYYFLFLSI